MKELHDTIDFLKTSLEKRIFYFYQRKPNRSLIDLPDELLSIILELTTPTLSDLMGLSLVCKKLRLITISIPSLWARHYIDTSMPEDAVDLIVSRSGTRALHLKVESPYVPNDVLFSYCDRWEDIVLCGLSASELQLFQRLSPSADLTSLRSLHILGSSYAPYLSKFDNDWRPANLEILHCSLSIPMGLNASTLTNCRFDFDSYININTLANFLSFAACLTQLSINIGQIGAIDKDDDVQIKLPSLQTFLFHSYRASEDAVLAILQATSFPNVTNLSVTTAAGGAVDAFEIRSCCTTILEEIMGNLQHLEGLNLKVDCGELDDEDDAISFCLDEVFANLPDSIKSLSFTACDMGLCPPCDAPFDTLKKLRSVKFEDCNCLDDSFFEKMADRFKEEEILLNVLQIWDCQEKNADELIDAEAVTKLFRDTGVLQT